MLCVSSESNPYLPDGYTDRLQNLDEDTKKRMLRGEWSNVACGVFTHFNRSLHVAPCKHLMNPESCPEIVIGQDLGGGAKWAGHVVIGKGFDNKIYCFSEWMVKNITHQQALTWMEPYRAITGGVVVYDSANAVAKNEMTNHGWKCIDSIKNIEGSIAVMNNLFAQNAVVIDPSCEVLIAQLEEAYRNPETGHVAKWRDWDVLDAFRYSTYSLSSENHEKEDGLNYFMVF
jgi:phage terminase large subunit